MAVLQHMMHFLFEVSRVLIMSRPSFLGQINKHNLGAFPQELSCADVFLPLKLNQLILLIVPPSTWKGANHCKLRPVVFPWKNNLPHWAQFRAAGVKPEEHCYPSYTSTLMCQCLFHSWAVARLLGSCWPLWSWTPSLVKPCNTAYTETRPWLVTSPSPCASSQRPSTPTLLILSTVWSYATRWGSVFYLCELQRVCARITVLFASVWVAAWMWQAVMLLQTSIAGWKITTRHLNGWTS